MSATARRGVEEFAGEKLKRPQLQTEKLRLPSSRTRWAEQGNRILQFFGFFGGRLARSNMQQLTATHNVFRMRNEHAFRNSREHFVDDQHAREAVEAVAGNSMYFHRIGEDRENPNSLEYRYIARRLQEDPDLFRRQVREDLQRNQESRLGRFFTSFGFFKSRMTDRKMNSIWDRRSPEVSGAMLSVYEGDATARRILDKLRNIHQERVANQPPAAETEEHEGEGEHEQEGHTQQTEGHGHTTQANEQLQQQLAQMLMQNAHQPASRESQPPINLTIRDLVKIDNSKNKGVPPGFMKEMGTIANYRAQPVPVKVVKTGGNASKAQMDEIIKLLKRRTVAQKTPGKPVRGGVTQKFELVQFFGTGKPARRAPTRADYDRITAELKKKMTTTQLVKKTAAKRAALKTAPTRYKLPKGLLRQIPNDWEITFKMDGRAILKRILDKSKKKKK